MKRCLMLTAAILCLALPGFSRAAGAAVRPQEFDPGSCDLNNGSYRLKIRDTDHIADEWWFTAALYVPVTYDAAQIGTLEPGDSIQVQGSGYTVTDVMTSESPFTGETDLYEVFVEEGPSFCFPVLGDGRCSVEIDDWDIVVPVGEVRIPLPLPETFEYIAYSEGDDNEPRDAQAFLQHIASWGYDFVPYNTRCTMKDGQMVYVIHYPYPFGPDEEYFADPVPVNRCGFSWTETEEPVSIHTLYGMEDNRLLENAAVHHYTKSADGTLTADDTAEINGEFLREMAMYGCAAGKADGIPKTGETHVYTFTDPDGRLLMTMELWNGYLVCDGSLYVYYP